MYHSGFTPVLTPQVPPAAKSPQSEKRSSCEDHTEGMNCTYSWFTREHRSELPWIHNPDQTMHTHKHTQPQTEKPAISHFLGVELK